MGSPAERVPSFEELYQAIRALPPALLKDEVEGDVERAIAPFASAISSARFEAGVGAHWWVRRKA